MHQCLMNDFHWVFLLRTSRVFRISIGLLQIQRIIDQLFMHFAFLLYTVQGLVWMTIWFAGLFWEILVQVSKISPY